jgi:hypothetical protein
MNIPMNVEALATIETRLDELARSGPIRALDLANQVADLVKRAVAPLEEAGHFEQAADLYDKAALAFRLAAEKVIGSDVERMAQLEDFWSAKADVTRYRVYTAPLTPPAEPSPVPVITTMGPQTRSLGPKPQPEGPKRATSGPKPPPVTLKKPAKTRAGRWSVAPTPSSTRASRSAFTLKKPDEAWDESWSATQSPPPTEQVERENDEPAESSHHEPRSHK